jgi:hypothetical protein
MKPPVLILCAVPLLAHAAELPVRQVILYKSGVAYFERHGRLGAGEAARLDFKADEMNDVLKSLAIRDLSGSQITGLRYDSSEPLDKKLADFPFKLGSSQSLSSFLDQVKGASLELKFGAETLKGTIVGARAVPAPEKGSPAEQVVLLLDNGDLRTFDLSGIAALRFADSRIQSQLKDYLNALDQARSREKRSVYIDSTGAGQRNISASYMTPAPVWKSSYRLVFGEKMEPMLEGWAIVDNTTGDDWNNVKLAVVSGRPVSFISRLYEPKFLQRPTMELPDEVAVDPTVYEPSAGLSVLDKTLPVPSPEARFKTVRPQAFMGAGRTGALANVEASPAFNGSGVLPQSEGRDLGDLFEYSFSTPVTVKKNESAMLPFLQQTVDARKLLIYQEERGANPMSAAEITNSTGKTLDGGPITVFDGNGYSGEALIATVKAGDKRLISYAVDLGTRITTTLDSSAEVVRTIHLKRGILETRLAAEETRAYTIRNIDQKAKSLIIEHPRRTDYKLLSQKPVEATASAYRFEIKLDPASTQTFAVKEERVYSMEVAVSQATPGVLVEYARNKNISEEARRTLERIRAQKEKIAATSNDVRLAEAALNDTAADEQRIRQNIDSLRSVASQAAQVDKYAEQLAARELQITEVRDRLSRLKGELAAQQAALDGMIAKLEF